MRSKLLSIVVAILVVWIFLDNHANAQSSLLNDSARAQAKLYFFTNAACGPCRQVEPEIVRLYTDGYPVLKVDTIAQPQWAQRFQVTKTPTVILVKGDQVVGRHSGSIDYRSLRRWFEAIGYRPEKSSPSTLAGAGQKSFAISDPSPGETPANLPKTVHRGTRVPASPAEREALNATVRLRVEDPDGISYATGTVIHSHNGESLVLTCGHVFRDVRGQCDITAEYGFAGGNPKQAPGEVIQFDAESRDIALVAIKPGEYIKPATIAPHGFPVQQSDQIFSVGCDHGETPTIRQSRIKNQAKYDGIKKYDIFGRPVVGRSGGGLFTPGGQLIGVCNAAVVDVDEGVYVGIDTVYWQIANVNLTHLFTGDRAIAGNFDPQRGVRLAGESKALESEIVRRDIPSAADIRAQSSQRDGSSVNSQWQTLAANDELRPVGREKSGGIEKKPAAFADSTGESELIVILRSGNPSQAETWTIRNPNEELVQRLRDSGRVADRAGLSSRNRLASLRTQMPDPAEKHSNRAQIRAQSPR